MATAGAHVVRVGPEPHSLPPGVAGGAGGGAASVTEGSAKAVEVRPAAGVAGLVDGTAVPSLVAAHGENTVDKGGHGKMQGRSGPASRSFRKPDPARRVPSFRQVATPDLAMALRVADPASPKPTLSRRVRTRQPGVQAFGHHARREADEAAFAAAYRDVAVDQSHTHPPSVDGATPSSRAAMRRASRRLMVGPESDAGVAPASPRGALGIGPVPLVDARHSWRVPHGGDVWPATPMESALPGHGSTPQPSPRVPVPPRVASLTTPGSPAKRRSLKARKAAYTQRRLQASAQLRKDCEFLRTRSARESSDDSASTRSGVQHGDTAQHAPRQSDGASDALAQPQPRTWEEGGDTLRMSVVHDYVHRSLEKPDVASSALWRFKVWQRSIVHQRIWRLPRSTPRSRLRVIALT